MGFTAFFSKLRCPTGTWSRSGTVLVLAVVTAPLLLTGVLTPGADIGHVQLVAQLLVAPLLLAVAQLLYFQYRVSGNRILGWLVPCVAVLGAQGLALAGLQLAAPGEAARHPGWVLVVDLVLVLGACGAAAASRRRPIGVDPLGAGVVLGLVVVLVHLGLARSGVPDLVLAGWTAPLVALVAALWCVAAALALQAHLLPLWASAGLAAGLVPVLAGRLVLGLGPDPAAVRIAVLTVTVLGISVTLRTALAGLRHVINQQRERVTALDRRLADLENEERDRRAQLHEITNTIAGIASASTLIHDNAGLPPTRRQRLEEMIASEASRLSRILATDSQRSGSSRPQGQRRDTPGTAQAASPVLATEAASPVLAAEAVLEPPAAPVTPEAPRLARVRVDLDTVLRPLVVAQEAVGRQVEWSPSGQQVLGHPDALAEAVNILLDNARKHAPDATTTVTARRGGSTVELVVSDDGPGVPAHLRERVFGWGQSGPGSRGQGLGLHLARVRLRSCGATLRLAPTDRGARFVITLAAAGHDPLPPPGVAPVIAPAVIVDRGGRS